MTTKLDIDEPGSTDATHHNTRATAPQQGRMFFRDVKPYEIPEKLDDLKGPSGGVVDLPHTVLWAPGDGHVDLDAEGGTGLVYRVLLSEGTVADQVAIMNRDRLVAAWEDLLLPRRVRELWETRFPELRSAVNV